MEKISHTEYGGERPLFAAHGLRLEQVTFLPGESALKECRGIVAERCEFRGKYPFWHNEGLSLRDCVFGEGARAAVWYSRRLRLVNCRISGTQPLCYAEELVLENCTMGPDCDLAFEHSTVRATIHGPLRSVKNPRSGSVTAESYGEIILDGYAKAPADCRIGMRCGPCRCA